MHEMWWKLQKKELGISFKCAYEFFITDDAKCSSCTDVCFKCREASIDDCITCDPEWYLSRTLNIVSNAINVAEYTCPNDYESLVCSPKYILIAFHHLLLMNYNIHLCI